MVGLLECLLSEHPSTVKWSCEALVLATSRGWLQHDSVLGALSAHASSMRHASMAVSAVGQLLMAEVKRLREGCCYVCPYSLRYHVITDFGHLQNSGVFGKMNACNTSFPCARTNMHPFICILNARPECGIYIVSELQTLLTSRWVEPVITDIYQQHH